MKLQLTNKPTKYITSKGREKFARLEWLGVITLDDGRSGQLAYNYDTCGYICLFNTTMYERLDTEEVQGLVSAAQEDANKPKVRAMPMRHYMVSLPDELADLARTMGAGNLSAGIRICIKIATGLPVDDNT